MKVPHNIVGRTRPTSAGLDPIRVNVDADAFGAGIARGLESLAVGVRANEGQNRQRQEKLDRFQSMTNYADFEIKVNNQLAELKKSADPTGKGFTEQAEKMYDIAADEFISKMIPEDMRMEARYWTSNTRQRIIGDAMGFQYEAGNAYFRTGVDKEYQNSLKALDSNMGGDPTQLQKEKNRLAGVIDGTDLSEIEKAKMKTDIAVGLEGVVYKQAVKYKAARGAGSISGPVGLIIDDAAKKYGVDPATMRAIAWIESKGNPNAKNTSSSAGGLFQQVDSNAKQYGVADRFDPVQSAEGAARFAADNIKFFRNKIGRDPTPGEVYLMHQQGPGGAVALLADPNRLAVDVLGYDKVRMNGGAPGQTAGQFAAMWDKKLRDAGGPDLDSSPLFSSLSYSDRISLQKDGEAEWAAEERERAAAEKFRVDSLTNNLLNRINDGLAGQTEIDTARSEGWLTDYDTIAKAQNLYEKRNGDINLAREGYARMEAGNTFNPASDDDKKMMNAMVGKPGLAAIEKQDLDYFTNGIVPMVTQTGDIPTDVVGLLKGMIRSNDQAKALFAFDALAMLQQADQRAFDNRVDDATASDVNFYRARRSSVPADQLFEALYGGSTQADRQNRTLLYKEAQDVLQTKEKGVTALSSMVENTIDGYNTWTSSAQLIGIPMFAKQLSNDFEVAFTDAYLKNPDPAWAEEEAQRVLRRNWGRSDAGGGILMKYPPEQVGYPTVLDSHAWIHEQARELLQLGEGERYELISDDRTASEVAAAKMGGPPPSYRVVTYDANGVPRVRTDADGVTPMRISFEKTPELFELEDLDFDARTAAKEIQEIEDEIRFYVQAGQTPPAVLEEQWKSLRAGHAKTVEEFKKRTVPQIPWRELPQAERPWMGLPADGFINVEP